MKTNENLAFNFISRYDIFPCLVEGCPRPSKHMPYYALMRNNPNLVNINAYAKFRKITLQET